MVIAIPSVTKYIIQSRKKIIVTTIGNYIKAIENDVNNLEYVFTGSDTIYVVPIECIALESGGIDPFGEWMQANNSYWAYVLVQYDDATSSYTYGFTFKDSAGYGLYPTIESKSKRNGKQIQTGLDLSRPKKNDITSLTTLEKWQELGFEVDETTNFQVLEAKSEGVTGDGINTCTLVKKRNNYTQVEEEKEIAKEEAIKDRILIKTTQSSTTDFWQYRDKIKTITFEDRIKYLAIYLKNGMYR